MNALLDWWRRWGPQVGMGLITTGVLLAIAVLTWQRGARNPVSPTPVAPSNPSIELRFLGVELRGRQQGTKIWSILAKEVEVSRDQNTVFLRGDPHGSFYNIKDWAHKASPSPSPPFAPSPAGHGVAAVPPPPLPPAPTASPERHRTITWHARSGEYTFANPGVTEQLILRDNVELRTDEHDVVSTKEVQWLPGQNRVVCPTRTILRAHEGTVIEADRIVTNTDLEVLELTGKVKFTVPVKRHQEL